jgi:alpha-1,3-glucosyltransferase
MHYTCEASDQQQQAVYSAFIAVHVLEMLLPPPARYPDLYPVLNVLISTPVFALTWLWSIKCGIEVTWALGGLPGTNATSAKVEGLQRQPSGESASSEAMVSGSDLQAGRRYASLGHSQSRQRVPSGMPVVEER